MPKVATRPSSLDGSLRKAAEPRQPLWTGPCGEGDNGGVTQSIIGTWLTCPERARLKLVEGLRPADQFNHYIEFGNMWHACEEALARGSDPSNKVDQWMMLRNYGRQLCQKYPLQQQQIDKWYNVVKLTFPEYVGYWRTHQDVTDRTNLFAERVFDVPYTLPSGRVARLRGKFDSVDVIGRGKTAGVYVQENKTKSDVDEIKIKRQVTFDLQTMFYAVAFQTQWADSKVPVKGVRYNVIRRPLSGGKGSIVQREASEGSKCSRCDGGGVLLKTFRTDKAGDKCPKCKGAGRTGGKPAETAAEYYERVRQYIAAEPETFFFRWKIDLSPQDINRFRRQCMEPILENMQDDAEWWAWCLENSRRVNVGGVKTISCNVFDGWLRHDQFPHHCPRHFVHPFGTRNILDEGGSSDLDQKISDNTEVGLVSTDRLFTELQE